MEKIAIEHLECRYSFTQESSETLVYILYLVHNSTTVYIVL